MSMNQLSGAAEELARWRETARHWVPSSSPEKVAAARKQQQLFREQASMIYGEQGPTAGSSAGAHVGGLRLARPYFGARVLDIWPHEPLIWD
jgi:hypothetical protein